MGHKCMDVYEPEYFYQPLKMYVAPHRPHLVENATLFPPALIYLTSLFLLVFLSLYVYMFIVTYHSHLILYYISIFILFLLTIFS